jgi:hypothetical protein
MCDIKHQMETIRDFHRENCLTARVQEILVFHSHLAGECVKRLKVHEMGCAACRAERETTWGTV